jgi:RNase P subunit RPR2
MSQYGDGDVAEAYRVTHHVARKEQRCCACSETIAPGHKYVRTFFVWEGEPYVFKRCARCDLIHQHLSDRIATEGESGEFCDEELHCGHDYEERWEEPPPEWLAALAFWRPGDPLPEKLPERPPLSPASRRAQ